MTVPSVEANVAVKLEAGNLAGKWSYFFGGPIGWRWVAEMSPKIGHIFHWTMDDWENKLYILLKQQGEMMRNSATLFFLHLSLGQPITIRERLKGP